MNNNTHSTTANMNQSNINNPLIDIENKILQNEENENDKKNDLFTRCLISSFILIISLPIIICDLYFAYVTSDCLVGYPKNININMRDYLVVSAVTTLYYVIFLIFYLFVHDFDRENTFLSKIFYSISYLSVLFLAVWNTIGCCIFWGFVYNCNGLSNSVSTYIFITLIIKLLSSISNLFQKK